MPIKIITAMVRDTLYSLFYALPGGTVCRYVRGGITDKACYPVVGSCLAILGILMEGGGASVLVKTSHKIFLNPRLYF